MFTQTDSSNVEIQVTKTCVTQYSGRKHPLTSKKYQVVSSVDVCAECKISTDGRALIVNLHKKAVLHHFNFKERVYDLKYSPDGRSHSLLYSFSLSLSLSLSLLLFVVFLKDFPDGFRVEQAMP